MKQPLIEPEAMLCFDIYTLQQAFGQLYKPLLDPLGLTYPQYLVMVLLWAEDGQSVGQMGRRLGLGTGTLTPLIKRLEQSGLVRRQRDDMDERRVFVRLTDTGRALKEPASRVPACVAEATGLTAEQIEHLRHTLARLRAAISDSALSRS